MGRLRGLRVVAGCVLVLFAFACADTKGPSAPLLPPEGVYHELERGETLYQLSKRYGVAVEDLVRANQIEDPTRVPVGTKIFIPGASAVLRNPSPIDDLALVRGCDPTPELRADRQTRALEEADVAFEWPLQGRITTCFAPENGRPHDGIDIAVPVGTPVLAAESGTVIFSARLGAYGNLIVLRHEGAYTSLYAHNDANLVGPGDEIEKGQMIAESGATGNATGPHLHFEIRRARRPDNPMLYLP